MFLQKVSDYFRHEFRAISRVRPLVWIMLYIVVIPIFALIYYWLPESQFRIPDNAGTDYGSWLYYSTVTITTLGFGDYTPAHGWAQAVTAVEVMCGLLFLGFFLNAVGSLKSENDVSAEIEKQQKLHEAQETGKLKKNIPTILHSLSLFLSTSYTLQELLNDPDHSKDIEFKTADDRLMKTAFNTALCLDSLQVRVDLTLWPELLENCFTFVANYQVFAADKNASAPLPDISAGIPNGQTGAGNGQTEDGNGQAVALAFLKENLPIAAQIEETLKSIETKK